MRALFFALLTLSACAAPTHQPAVMRIDGVCVKTACDVKPRRDGCGECLSACAASRASCNPDTACAASCSGSPTSCTEAERTRCVEKRFTAYVPVHGDPAIEEACHRASATAAGCGRPWAHADATCTTLSQVGRPDLATVLSCQADLACDADRTDCGVPTGDTLGGRLIGHRCGFHRDPLDFLLRSGAWLAPHALAAAASCLDEPNCDDVNRCLDAWLGAVAF